MAGNLSDYLEGKLIDVLFRATAAYKPAFIYLGLWNATLTDASTGATAGEPSGGGYARLVVSQTDANWSTAAAAGLTQNLSALTFVTATGSWNTVTDVGITDTSTIGGGNMLMYGALTASKNVQTGDTFKFNAGDLTITFG